ncbi:hypothetical protein, partial [Bradyrhizobium oropedii]|uniref:hypothetical protein n=1 Tax=Bradyrhizobium oropedii TaxID=1571201 RepID=UPI001E360372
MIDRSERKANPWDPVAIKGREYVWNLRRENHLGPAINPIALNRPDIWMSAIRSGSEALVPRGPST